MARWTTRSSDPIANSRITDGIVINANNAPN